MYVSRIIKAKFIFSIGKKRGHLMSYTALYRKFRPANFDEVKQAIKKDKEVNIDTLDDIENFAINEMIKQYGKDILRALR